jgi:hypothetical protein
MEDTITTIYCLCDDFLSAYGYEDDPQAEMSSAEVMTVALVAATFFGGKLEVSRLFLKGRYFSRVLSKSRFNRRLHALPEELGQALFGLLAEVFKAVHSTPTSSDGQPNPYRNEYIVDSLPLPVCDNIRIRRCRLYRGEAYRGWIASKRRYFYGLRVHLLITATGEPVEFFLSAGANNDLAVFREFGLELPEGSTIHADKLYNDYLYEDLLEDAGIRFQPLRKKNSKRPRPGWESYWSQQVRKQVETTFSQITALFPKTIHAVTARGFELKIVCFLLAFSFSRLSMS